MAEERKEVIAFRPADASAHSINEFLEYFDDPSGRMSFEQVMSEHALDFKPLVRRNLGYGYQGVMWIRFKADFESYKGRSWFLTQNYEHVRDWKLFYPSGKGYAVLGLEEAQDISRRQFAVHQYLLQIPTNREGEETYYLRHEPDGHAMSVDLTWYGEKALIENLHDSMFASGFFFGGLVVLLFYNLVLCVQLRSKVYLYYIYYLSCFLLAFLFLSGLAPLALTLTPRWEQFFAASCYAALHGMILFGRSFLVLKDTLPRVDRILWLMQWLLAAGIVAAFLLEPAPLYVALNFGILISAVGLIASGINRSLHNDGPAKIYTAGWLFFSVALIVYAMRSLGLVKVSWWTTYSVQVAAVWEATLFSLALAARLKNNAADSVKAKNTFIAAISHELKTPLQTIVSCLDLISGNGGGGKNKKIFERLRSAAGQLEVQVNDLTDYARLESGKLSLKKSAFDVCELVREVVSDYQGSASAKGLSLTAETAMEKLCVVSDPWRVKQILNNLVENGIKYTDSGFVVVRLALIDGSTPQLMFTVEDSGIGISDAHIKSIYEPFTQVDQGVQRKYGGIGMGLAIVRDLISLLGGSVDVKSIPGKGSSFQFRIPCEMAPGNGSMADESQVSNGRRRVLLVDDNEEVLFILSEIISSLGYDVDAFSSGREAIVRARDASYYAILLDVNMPDMDGFAVAAEMRELRAQSKAPIVWISATRPDISDGRNRSLFNHFLEKPIHAPALEKLLNSLRV